MDHNESSSLDRLRSLRNNLGWTLIVQIIAMIGLAGLELCSISYKTGLPLLLTATMIGATIFGGGRLMKIVMTKQELEGKNVTLNTPMGLYAFFLVAIPLLFIVGIHYKIDWLFTAPVLFLPIYATIPLIVICRWLDRFLEKIQPEKHDQKTNNSGSAETE